MKGGGSDANGDRGPPTIPGVLPLTSMLVRHGVILRSLSVQHGHVPKFTCVPSMCALPPMEQILPSPL